MEKNRLLLLPFFIGLVLFIYSFFLTYPLSTNSANDLVFNHVSVIYWVSLPLLSASMFLMALTTKSNLLRWIFSIGSLLIWFSLFYFYSMMPTGDSEFFRGFTEYFLKSKSLDPSNHGYYQWPGFFILALVVTSVSGLSLANYEFLLFAIILFFLATSLYVYSSKKFGKGGILAVPAFFISVVYFTNLQSVPFSLALGILFVLFMLETHEKNTGTIIIMMVLFGSLLLTHLFVPLFFVLYLLMRFLFDKLNRVRYVDLFVLALVSYFVIQTSLASFEISRLFRSLFNPPVETLNSIVSQSLASSSGSESIGAIAQFFSRTVTILAVGLCVVGFIIIFYKKKLNVTDKAILFSGMIYSGLGVVLNFLGWRAVAVAFFPISLGAAFLFESKKIKRYVLGIFLVLIVLSVFVPIHQSLNPSTFQTKETYVAQNFFIDHYNFKKSDVVVADLASAAYIPQKLSIYEYIPTSLNKGEKADAVLFSPEFTGQLGNYGTMENFSQEEGLNLMFNDGSFYIYVKHASK